MRKPTPQDYVLPQRREAVGGGFWKTFGPGLIWAATAIGVSHLVQSTRAARVEVIQVDDTFLNLGA